MRYIEKEVNENDLINNYTKEQLKTFYQLNIKEENYEGAKVIKSAIDQYDDAEIVNIENDIEFKE